MAFGINTAGQVVGYSDTHTPTGDQRHAFITGPSGMSMIDLAHWEDLTVPPTASTLPGKWWGFPLPPLQVTAMFSSPAPTEWV